MHPRPAQTRIQIRRGFTLIELLTVIAIIGILAAILIPTVAKVRQTAKKSECVSRMRQWGSTVLLFASDNKDQIALSVNANDSFYENYFSGKKIMIDNQQGGLAQVEVQKAMAKCPKGKSKGFGTSYDYAFSIPIGSTTLNLPNKDGEPKSVDAYKIANAASPSKLLLMAELEEGSTKPSLKPGSISGIKTQMDKVRKTQWGVDSDGNSMVRHNGTANALFLDGHVAGLTMNDTDYTASKETLDQWFTLR